jgi:cation transport ATPase-like protein
VCHPTRCVYVGVDLNISKKKLEFPGSIENGLTAEQVQAQLVKYGFNEIPEKRSLESFSGV